MTSREWRSDRRAVFERDGFTCRNCGTAGDDVEPTSVRTYPVGDVPLEGTVHGSSLVTVCSRCFSELRDGAALAAPTPDREALFDLVRQTTRTQGATIADVASFASLATSLPGSIDEAATADGEAPSRDGDGRREPGAEYVQTRREVLLSLDVVDVRLDRLADVEPDPPDTTVTSLLESMTETATTLQSDLREVVELGETVVAGLDRCHGCYEPIAAAETDGTCGTCGLAPRETADWRRSNGDVAYEDLFAAINETLRGTSETTETLTDRTMQLAESLQEE